MRSTCSSGSEDTIQRLAARSVGSASASRSISIGSSTPTFSSGDSASADQWRVSPRARLEIGVEGHLHLDGQLHGIRFAAGRTRALCHGGEQRVGIQFHALAAGADQTVGDPSGEPRSRRTGRSDVDGNRLLRTVVDGGVPRSVVRAVERDAVRCQQCLDERDRLLEASKTLLESGHSVPSGASFMDLPVPTPSQKRPGNMLPSVPIACATTAGW